MRVLLAAAAIVLVSSAVFAQSISVADLRAQIDARVGGLNEYQELLNDPDPARSVAAMEIMMGSGDPALVKMAKDYGIFSPSPAVRKAALDGYFSSGPVLEMRFDASTMDDFGYITRVLGPIDGSVAGNGVGFVSVKLGDWIDNKSCYSAPVYDRLFLEDGCFLRNSENGVSLYLWNVWWFLVLDDEGALVGSGNAFSDNSRYGSIGGLPISIQIAQ